MIANSYANPSTAGGNREDLRDILTILEPEETPFTSMVKKGESPHATLVEVLADNLRPARISGTKEGQDAGKGNNKAKNRQRFGSFVHRVQDEFGVTDVQQKVSQKGGVAAVDNEYGNAKAKCVREVKRDIEAVCCSGQEMQGGSDLDMLTRGIFQWILSTAQAVQPVPAAFRPPAQAVGSGGNPATTTFTGATTNPTIMSAFGSATPATPGCTEQEFNTELKNLNKIYGGKRTYEVIGGDNVIETVDNFTRINSSTTNIRYQVMDDASSHTINLRISQFEGSFGIATMIPTQFNNVSASTGLGDPNVAYFLNMDLWTLLFLDPLHSVDQDENAGGESGYVKAMFALLCLNPKGNGKFFNA